VSKHRPWLHTSQDIVNSFDSVFVDGVKASNDQLATRGQKNMGQEQMDPSPEAAEQSMWEVDDDTAGDPEEQRVMFCAIDSYL
jgi:hypothetical protein